MEALDQLAKLGLELPPLHISDPNQLTGLGHLVAFLGKTLCCIYNAQTKKAHCFAGGGEAVCLHLGLLIAKFQMKS